MEDFTKKIIIEGRKYIIESKWCEWQATIENIASSQQNPTQIKEYFQDLINILRELKDKEIPDIIANLKANNGNLNTTYTKCLVEQAAKFSPKGPKLLIHFINTFTDISQQEDNRLTTYIDNLNKINKYLNEGLSYEEAELMINKVLIPVTIDEHEARVISYDSFSKGLTQSQNLILISELSEDVILSYIFLDQENYIRYLFQDSRRTVISKLLITDKFDNLLDFKKADDLVSFNNSIILQDNLLDVYKESNRLYEGLNKDILASVLEEINYFSNLNKQAPIVVSEDILRSSNDKRGKRK